MARAVPAAPLRGILASALPARLLAAGMLLVLPLWGCGGEDPPPPPGARARYDATGGALVPAPRPASAPNLLLVVLDGLRADVLAPGEGGSATPHLAALAAQGVSFQDAVTPAPWSLPALASLLTGLLPGHHGMHAYYGHKPLPDAHATYAEILARTYGYRTFAAVDERCVPPAPGLLQGFERVVAGALAGGGDAALSGLAEAIAGGSGPWFALVHGCGAAPPWERPSEEASSGPWTLEALDALEPGELARAWLLDPSAQGLASGLARRRLERKVARYRHEGHAHSPHPGLGQEAQAAWREAATRADGRLGALLGTLRARGLLGNTVVVVTSGHAVAFGEHGALGHGTGLFEEEVRIPLVFLGGAPLAGGRSVRGAVALQDVLPTFFAHAGLLEHDAVDGASALALLAAPAGTRPDRAVLLEDRLDPERSGLDEEGVRVGARSMRWKYVGVHDVRAGTVVESLYDLEADPGETRDLAGGDVVPSGLGLDPVFCAAVEAARDRLWVAVADSKSRVRTPYGAGVAEVTATRPQPCGP